MKPTEDTLETHEARALAARWVVRPAALTSNERDALFAWVRTQVAMSSVGSEREFIADYVGARVGGKFAKGDGTKGTALAWDLCEASRCWS